MVVIQERLNRREYPTLTPVESDLRRMVGNAKSFNEKSSEIFSDAEKIRKILVAFMTQNNPAYKSRSYVPAPTPIPDGWQDRLEAEQEEPPGADNGSGTDHEASMKEDQDQLTRPTITARSSSANVTDSRRATSTPAVQDAQGAGESFEGDTFQQAQEKIMTELINLKNDESVRLSLLHDRADCPLQGLANIWTIHQSSLTGIEGLLSTYKASCLLEECAKGREGRQRQRETYGSYVTQKLASVRGRE